MQNELENKEKELEERENLLNENLYERERQVLVNALVKIENQIDSLKHYLHLSNSKEKSIAYAKIVTKDLEEIYRYQLLYNYKKIEDDYNKKVKNKKKEDKKRGISVKNNFSLAKLGQLLARKNELLKKAQEELNKKEGK